MRLRRTLIGMVHLPPLPGSPRWAGSMDAVRAAALADACALVEEGMDALLVENFGDVPFTAGRVGAPTVAAVAVVAAGIRAALPSVPLGVNVLRNDGRSALGVAVAVGAAFIRVNVHAWTLLTDQGLVAADAHDLLRERRLLGADVAVFADVQSKHAVTLGAVEIEQEARDVVHRGLADAVIVSGKTTGQAASLADLKRVRGAVPDTPLVVGSGVTADNVAEIFSLADAAIVGTSLKRDGDVTAPVDRARVRRLVAAARAR
jgi:membrane complex biogenesis BtpA family protein